MRIQNPLLITLIISFLISMIQILITFLYHKPHRALSAERRASLFIGPFLVVVLVRPVIDPVRLVVNLLAQSDWFSHSAERSLGRTLTAILIRLGVIPFMNYWVLASMETTNSSLSDVTNRCSQIQARRKKVLSLFWIYEAVLGFLAVIAGVLYDSFSSAYDSRFAPLLVGGLILIAYVGKFRHDELAIRSVTT